MTTSRRMHTGSCPKCPGDMFFEEDEYHDKYWACLQCGNRISLDRMEEIMVNKRTREEPSPETIREVALRYNQSQSSDVPDEPTEVEPVKVYSCKKCDFTTPDKYKLIGHYGSKHSWRHAAEQKKDEEIMETPGQEAMVEPDPMLAKYLPPVPARPDTTGLSMRQKNGLIHDYYEDKAQGIVPVVDNLAKTDIVRVHKPFAYWEASE